MGPEIIPLSENAINNYYAKNNFPATDPATNPAFTGLPETLEALQKNSKVHVANP